MGCQWSGTLEEGQEWGWQERVMKWSCPRGRKLSAVWKNRKGRKWFFWWPCASRLGSFLLVLQLICSKWDLLTVKASVPGCLLKPSLTTPSSTSPPQPWILDSYFVNKVTADSIWNCDFSLFSEHYICVELTWIFEFILID